MACCRQLVTSSIEHGGRRRLFLVCNRRQLTTGSVVTYGLRRRLLLPSNATWNVRPTRQMIINSPYPALSDDVFESPMTSLAHFVINEASKYSKQIAMVDGVTGRQVTYSELQTMVIKVSSSLVQLGLVNKGSVVTLYSTNCIEYSLIYLVVIAAGGIISPANPAYTVDELVYALNLVNSSLLVTTESLLPTARQAMQLCPHVKELIVFGDGHANSRPLSSLYDHHDMSHFREHLGLDPKNDVAVLPFSSGTTGLPKGVELTHFCVRANVQQVRSPYSMGFHHGEECLIAVLPFYHIYGQTMLMLSGLASGGKIVTVPKFDPLRYLDVVQKYRATYLMIVPPIMLFLAEHPQVTKTDFSSVRVILSGAAPLGAATVDKVRDKCRSSTLAVRQAYGMTEASPLTHSCTATHCKDHSVGPAIQNTQFKIVDLETGYPLGEGQDGEVFIRGPQIMKGYFKNEKATRETIDDDGWLHTGDIGHFDEDKHLVIADRRKELIKVKAFQVAPAELEALLLTHESVEDVAVVGRYVDERVGELPTAFVVLKPSYAHTTQQQLQQFVAQHVAAYKQLTGGVIFCSQIPKSPSGKILRRELRDQLKAMTSTTV